MMNIYVGNVPYAATEENLENLFSKYGTLVTTTIIRDRYDGRSKGFGFVEMENQEDGKRAIEALDGYEMMGRPLKVNPARPRPTKTSPPRERSERQHGRFHNPYTFVPSPPRDKIKPGEFAGDFDPLKNNLDHVSLNEDLWTGHIPIKITTVTPLVLLKDDSGERELTKHQKYDVHSRIPESSLRGMLRSAYEVVTNSRYSCFRNNDRLAYRMETRESVKLIPTIIKKSQNTEKLEAYFFTGTTFPKSNGPKKPPKNNQKISADSAKKCAMYAAMLTCYKNKKDKTVLNGKYKNPKTGDKVYAEIILCDKQRYLYWKASQIWLKSDCTKTPKPSNVPDTWNKNSLYKDENNNPVIKVVEGTVLITNQNIDGKHDERIFFLDSAIRGAQKIEIDDDHKKSWNELIKNYRDVHTDDDIFNRKDVNGEDKKPWEVFKNRQNTTEYAWSPHLYHKGERIQGGTMAYARCKIDDETGTIKKVIALFPVMISRELYENTPKELLDKSLRPAEKLDDLSPADRLFGWTSQEESIDPSYKSRIRVVCEDSERPTILKDFQNNPLPLAILGQPKPEQGRFYVAADEEGTPQHCVRKQKAGYDMNGKKQLRGRKHYWHHKSLETGKDKAKDYWDPSKDQNQEYIRTDRVGDTQNRSIKGWIKPDNEFRATLYVQNLQPKEVGGLLWLLSLNDNLNEDDDKHHFRLGYGKPLGFGSVKIEIDADRLESRCLPLANDKDWKAYYASLDAIPPAKLNDEQQKQFTQQFMKIMVDTYSPSKANFENLTFIKGFLRVLQGPIKDAPIHYPRLSPTPDRDGKNFKWFMANEKGKQLALPDVNDDNDAGLPYIPSEPKSTRR